MTCFGLTVLDDWRMATFLFLIVFTDFVVFLLQFYATLCKNCSQRLTLIGLCTQLEHFEFISSRPTRRTDKPFLLVPRCICSVTDTDADESSRDFIELKRCSRRTALRAAQHFALGKWAAAISLRYEVRGIYEEAS